MRYCLIEVNAELLTSIHHRPPPQQLVHCSLRLYNSPLVPASQEAVKDESKQTDSSFNPI